MPALNHTGRRGGIAIEVALTMPVIVLLFVGIVEWGVTFPQQLQFENIARDAARAGSVELRVDDPEGAAVAMATHRLTQSGFTPSEVTVTTSIDPSAGGDALTVTVTKDYTALFGLVPTPLQLIGTASFRLEDNT
ncbi:MAG: pilus assembly protein [Alphaproteobacteria bacterium]|nr:pilus assembly protein [Alphaproteobacteria bacterium]